MGAVTARTNLAKNQGFVLFAPNHEAGQRAAATRTWAVHDLSCGINRLPLDASEPFQA
jgi:hypothetical protein